MLPILSAHPLISAVLLLVIDLLAWQLVDERHKPWKIAARLGIFLLYSLLIFEAGLSPLQAAPWSGDVPLHLLAIVLEIVWWLFCARTLTVVIGPLLMPRGGHTGRLVQDVLGAIIFLVAIVAAAAYVMELPVRGLLATSGAVAIIVGLALQSTLGDVFSGIVLNTTKPYQLDDWISIDGIEGKVVEIDWRSTHLLTAQGSMAVVPNSVAAKAKILNLSRPRDVHGVSIRLELPRLVRPRKALDALERALQGCSELLSTPKASVGIKSSGIDSVEYELTGFVDAMAKKAAVRNQLYDLAYRHLEASAVLREDAPAQTPREISRARALLDEVKIFRTLSGPQKDELSGHLMRQDHAAGEEVIAIGALTEDLLIIGSGVIEVSVADGATLIEAGRMGPGEIMGEESLISGQPSQARFAALTACVLYRIDKAHIQTCLEAGGEVAEAMTRLHHFRQQASQSLLLQKPVAVHKAGFLSWLRKR